MAYNGAILSRAREALARRREENAAELERRTRGVYARIPRVREIDSLLRRQMARLCALAFSGDGAEVEALRRSNLGLQAERAALLASVYRKVRRWEVVMLVLVPQRGISTEPFRSDVATSSSPS